MSHFAYYNPGGIWALETVIPHGFLQQIDQNLFKAVNGDDGGTWAPSSPIVIGGSGLAMTGNFSAASSGTFDVFSTKATFSNAVWIGTGASPGDFQVFSESAFNGAAGFNAGITTTTLDALGAVTLGNTLAVVGNGTFSSGISVASGATFGSTASFVGAITATAGISAGGGSAFQTVTCNSTLNIAGGATVTTAMACSGAGRVARPAVIGAASGGGTASPVTGNEYYFPSVTADETYAIDDTNAVNGDWIEFWTNSATNSVTVNDPASVPLQTIKNAGGSYVYMKVKRILGSWKLIGLTKA